LPEQLSHVTTAGDAAMVDVSAKTATRRVAVAEGFVRMQPETLKRVLAGDLPKGQVLGPARLAGIMAAKRTGELIPLCHPLPLEHVQVDITVAGDGQLRIVAQAVITAKTGVEMEALVAVAVAGLTVVDMVKAIDPGLVLEGVRVLEKAGGKSHYVAAEAGK
jgi:cyclic pyranopterin phosphate synthase